MMLKVKAFFSGEKDKVFGVSFAKAMRRNHVACVLCILLASLEGVVAFTPALKSPQTTILSRRNDETSLYGVRSSIRKAFRAIKVPLQPDSSDNRLIHSVQPSLIEATSNDTQSTEQDRMVSSMTTTKLESEIAQINMEDSLYSLPPIQGELTELQREFRGMLEHFSDYTEHDILSLKNERMRILIDGVIASAHDRAVYRAFEVLYEDLLPLRLGGRMMYARLENLMRESIEEREQDVRAVQEATDLSEETIEEVRLAFVTVATRLNGEAYLTTKQLIDSGFQEAVVDVLPPEYLNAFIEEIERRGERIKFLDMILSMVKVAESICLVEKCDPLALVKGIMAHIHENPPQQETDHDEKRQKRIERYNEMVGAFKDWEDLIPDGEGRRLDIVRGCFVGAENEKVVKALRILYVDVKPLKLAGDVIFGIVKSVMKQREKNHATK